MDLVSTSQRERIHPHKFIMWVALASIIMMFAGLTSAYVVKSSQANWESVQIPKLFWVSTIMMLLSSMAIQMSLRAFKQREMNRYRILISVTALLGIGFVVTQWFAFQWLWNSGVHLRGSGAGQFLYIIAGLHAIHVLGGIIAILFQIGKAFFGRTINYNSVPIEIVSTYWHFVDFLWLYLFLFLMLIR